MRLFRYYIREGPQWEDYRLSRTIAAETMTQADKVFQETTGLNPRSRGISVTLEPLSKEKP